MNDAPALTQADVGITNRGEGDECGDRIRRNILVRNDPRDIPKIIRLSRLTYVKMLQNLFWATGYNVIAIPLAAGILHSKEFFESPLSPPPFYVSEIPSSSHGTPFCKDKSVNQH